MKYKWALIGCGHIANEMAQAMADMRCKFYCLASRTYDKAVDFAQKYGIEKVYKSIDEMLMDDEIDIVYIATPHNSHIEYLRKALGAGKHVLCEKAITLNTEELEEAIQLAEEKGLVLAEAMTIFHCPVYKKIDQLVEEKGLGKLKTIQVNLGSYKEYDMTNRFFNLDLAGGAMLDIGVYALSFARYFMTECPNEVYSVMTKAPTGADEQVNIILKNANDEMATVTLSLVSKLPKMGIAGFEHGYVSFDNYNRTNRATVTYTDDKSTEIVETNDIANALGYEVMDMESAVDGTQNNMHLDLTHDVMKIMTDVRHKHGMIYPEEK